MWDWRNDRALDYPPLPPPIKVLNPIFIEVSRNYVVIQPYTPVRTRIIAYSEGTESYPLFTGPVMQLTDSLYFKTVQ